MTRVQHALIAPVVPSTDSAEYCIAPSALIYPTPKINPYLLGFPLLSIEVLRPDSRVATSNDVSDLHF